MIYEGILACAVARHLIYLINGKGTAVYRKALQPIVN